MHGNDITIGGERSAVESFIRMTSEKYEVKKQVIGEDPDLEKSGTILNRDIEWNREGITIEADQRHVREILKGLESERIALQHHVLCEEGMKARETGWAQVGQRDMLAKRLPPLAAQVTTILEVEQVGSCLGELQLHASWIAGVL